MAIQTMDFTATTTTTKFLTNSPEMGGEGTKSVATFNSAIFTESIIFPWKSTLAASQ